MGKTSGRTHRKQRIVEGNCFQAFFGIVLVILISWLSGCAGMPGGFGGAAPADPNHPIGPADFIIQTVWFFLVCLFVYWMMVLRPSSMREDSHKKFLADLKKNDEVLTSSGIFARVVSVSPEFVTLEISPNVKIRVQPSAVLPVTKPEPVQSK